MTSIDGEKTGTVYLLGAGPGDPGLLTLRAYEILQRANVVLYDYLVNPVALRHARDSAEIISLGKHSKSGASRIWSQDEINAKLVEFARQGKCVVRLKSGDPMIFGRATEEISALAAARIPFEVVPGVTAALAAGAFAGIPVTHRDLASAVAFITGQETRDKDESNINFAVLANFPGTLVFYMGVTTAKIWAPKLIAAGKPRETPVAIIRRCSFPDQWTITTTLGEVANVLTPSDKIRPPVIVIVGEVVRLRDSLAWFDKRPLFGQRVLVTRPESADDTLARLLEERGAEVISHPVIQIGPPAGFAPLDAAISQLAFYDWLLFSSVNGVRGFFNRLATKNLDARALGRCKVAAVGPTTAAALLEFGIRCDENPDENFRAEGLIEALQTQVRGKRCLSIRGSRGRDALSSGLSAAGAIVEDVSAYSSHDVTFVPPAILEQMSAREIDWTIVTSSAIARSTVALFGQALHKTKLASLSPLTTEALKELGFTPSVEAQQATMESLADAICNAT
jgi:uroporphyrinogen III methyltransferase / synthase